MKKTFLHGVTAGVLSGIASLVYNTSYSEAMWADFSEVVNPGAIMGACIFGCVLASVGYHFLTKWMSKGGDMLFNGIFLALSLASFVSPFAAELPLTIESPELFVGLTIPMHLFPMLFWLAVKPLFFRN